MTEQLYNISKDQNETSNGLLNDIRRRSSLNRMYEKQSLALKKKLVEERKKAYDAASRKEGCLLYTSPSPRDGLLSRMPSSA